ncbi:UNVERIFIED_CONTAM: hypothetical protein GTU68_063676 [Idotea baltica]|nr:hypothetical protein [Idotea baltica]
MSASKPKKTNNTLAYNKKAKFSYELYERFEAGLVLTGNEIKSIRLGKINLAESFIKVQKGELWLANAHVNEYSHSSEKQYNPTRPRKLLMHKAQINKLQGTVDKKGLTIVAISVYLKKGRAKLEIALAKGKNAPDKRKTTKDRELKKQAERAMKSSR